MDNKVIKECDIYDMLAVCNPFGLRDIDGKLKWYATLVSCYKDMIKRLLLYDYIDPVLFVCQTWNVSSARGVRIVKSWGGEYRKPCYYIKLSWHDDVEGTRKTVADFLKHCLLITGQQFNYTVFDLAFDCITELPNMQ